MTAGSWETYNNAVAIQAIISANATTASRVITTPKFKDQVVVTIYQTA